MRHQCPCVINHRLLPVRERAITFGNEPAKDGNIFLGSPPKEWSQFLVLVRSLIELAFLIVGLPNHIAVKEGNPLVATVGVHDERAKEGSSFFRALLKIIIERADGGFEVFDWYIHGGIR